MPLAPHFQPTSLPFLSHRPGGGGGGALDRGRPHCCGWPRGTRGHRAARPAHADAQLRPAPFAGVGVEPPRAQKTAPPRPAAALQPIAAGWPTRSHPPQQKPAAAEACPLAPAPPGPERQAAAAAWRRLEPPGGLRTAAAALLPCRLVRARAHPPQRRSPSRAHLGRPNRGAALGRPHAHPYPNPTSNPNPNPDPNQEQRGSSLGRPTQRESGAGQRCRCAAETSLPEARHLRLLVRGQGRPLGD